MPTTEPHTGEARRMVSRGDQLSPRPDQSPTSSSHQADGSCFHGGAFFEAVGEEFHDLDRRRSIINADVLDAWFPPAPSVLAALSEHLVWLLQTSPPILSQGLARVIASARGVPAECVLPGAGSSGLIFLALRSWLTHASRVLLLDPTYGEYAHVCEKVIGCSVDQFRLDRRDGYDVDLERLAARLGAGYDLVVLVNPNNPTGRHVAREHLEAVLRSVPARTRCWVDEAYVDYAGTGQSLETFAASTTNVVVCKSLSKAYALSGARAAYLVAAGHVVEELRSLSPPWAVALPAQVAAARALQERAYYTKRHGETHTLREELVLGIRSVAPRVDIIAGVGNFVLIHLPNDGPDAAEIDRRCRTQGLYVRNAGRTSRVLGAHALRVAVKDGKTQRRMLEVLEWALAAEPGAAPDPAGFSDSGTS